MSKREQALKELGAVIRRNGDDAEYTEKLLAYALSLEKAIYDKRRPA